ncbi:alkaline phosphatase family protein [Aeromicrobium wangtongii]|uniref:Alkaline phosphatase family protein n=1 Tax=Aeromicrobium wangtongii TaxID=2969247 RepID=A0ABY5MD79_9ACTN|nr:nucleotide pyrophosphatase/phosphodiesterase family protein [Aeromicrobium wangtongii]MCD9197651.1 alkaline phosphatase family protein [Aeromicrobium wangtongii]UUP15136.1 alkaline phosphatase family protein [Aeromicrobium wangtongii]
MPSVAAAMGVDGFTNTLGLPEAPRYVVFLVDGLGLELLREHAGAAPFLSSLTNVEDVVCGVPSTTVTSLTSLGTGLQGGQHGMVGYTARVPETGRRMNSLKWDQPIDPTVWQPFPTVLQQLREAGISASSVNDAKFEGTGLTVCSQRGVPFHGINSVYERLDVVVDVIESAPRAVTYAYESRLDHTGHSMGCTSAEWREMLTTIDTELAELRDELPRDTVLIVTADHGMLDLPFDQRFDVDLVPRLLDDVTLLAGEARFRHVYTRPGAADEVAARWRSELGDRAVVRTQDGIEDWFGPISDDVRGRIGDVVVASLGDFAVFSSREFGVELKMTGFHGSITEAELRIPVLVAT